MRRGEAHTARIAVWGDAIRVKPEIEISIIGKEYRADPEAVLIAQTHAGPGGNTSVRNVDVQHLEWKTQGYYQRNRDLGQVFTVERTFLLDAIVLRTGPADGAVLPGSAGAKVFVQFFEVMGEPHIHDNGTPPGSDAKHGFSSNHRCDDYIVGVRYRPLQVVRGGIFPKLPPTRDEQGKPTGDLRACLTYLRWRFQSPLRFEEGKRYAFMVGFEEPGPARGFTLANANSAWVDAPPSLTDEHDHYHGGWGIRREGDGTLPPTMIPGETPPADVRQRARLQRESLFPTGVARYRLSPTTDGYPDVDTYRDLEFYLEGRYTDSVHRR